MAIVFDLETARKILVDILKTVALPENNRKLQDAKGLTTFPQMTSSLLNFYF